MPQNPSSPNNSEPYNTAYTPNGYDKARLRKILVIVVGVLVCIGIAFVVYFLASQSEQSKYAKSATAAARRQTPNAEASDVKVAGGFALAIVKDPTAEGQANAGNTTIFKVNKDGSMTQIASGSSFSPLDLLELGISLTTQAELTKGDIDQVKQDLANACGYDGGSTPGYSGFNASFNPGGWKIDSLTLDSLGQVLNTVVGDKNTGPKSDKTIICVNATQNGSSITADIFTIEVQFITSDGTLTKHKLSYTIESGYRRSFTLDGQKIDE